MLSESSDMFTNLQHLLDTGVAYDCTDFQDNVCTAIENIYHSLIKAQSDSADYCVPVKKKSHSKF